MLPKLCTSEDSSLLTSDLSSSFSILASLFSNPLIRLSEQRGSNFDVRFSGLDILTWSTSIAKGISSSQLSVSIEKLLLNSSSFALSSASLRSFSICFSSLIFSRSARLIPSSRENSSDSDFSSLSGKPLGSLYRKIVAFLKLSSALNFLSTSTLWLYTRMMSTSFSLMYASSERILLYDCFFLNEDTRKSWNGVFMNSATVNSKYSLSVSKVGS
mmetsp:Transcript_32797/g.37515  ORF Transcript_32797/g.37515 Transcript_32797/m.37515 type:complete len:215 (-) Transcript_32797:1617-2261(-)